MDNQAMMSMAEATHGKQSIRLIDGLILTASRQR